MIRRTIQRFTASREQRAQDRELENVFEEMFDLPNTKRVRSWSTQKLHEELADRRLSQAQRTVVESELGRREAWAAPAGRAVWISLLALAVAAVSLYLDITNP